ncbi:MAG: hypothetical protein Q7T26_00820 [Dehalococcoidia bacterium]|nr:hypothetical protein [Dehalococcoidia bacterium]
MGTHEPAQLWRVEIMRMRELLKLWNIAREASQGDTSKQRQLMRYVTWPSENEVLISDSQGQQQDKITSIYPANRNLLIPFYEISDKLSLMERLAKKGENAVRSPVSAVWQKGDVTGPALYYIYDMINMRLGGVWDQLDQISDGHVKPRLLRFRDGEILLVADCLLAALYCLFALEISGKTPLARTCAACGELFKPEHRRDARTCSPRCRMAFSRATQRGIDKAAKTFRTIQTDKLLSFVAKGIKDSIGEDPAKLKEAGEKLMHLLNER